MNDYDLGFDEGTLLKDMNDWVNFDTIGKVVNVANTLYACGIEQKSQSCAKNIFNTVSDYEPTGLASLAKSLIFPECPGYDDISRRQI